MTTTRAGVVSGLALALAVLPALLAGCGDGFAGEPAKDIASAARTDMDELASLRYRGELTGELGTVGVDVRANADGDCTGTLSIGDGTAELLVTGGHAWIRPDEAFWRGQAPDQADAIIAAVGTKWVVATDARFIRFCDIGEFLDVYLPAAGEAGVLYVKAGADELDGQDVVRIQNQTADGTATGYVLVDEPHLLVRVERTDSDQPALVDFSDFDEAVEVAEPAADEVADLSGR